MPPSPRRRLIQGKQRIASAAFVGTESQQGKIVKRFIMEDGLRLVTLWRLWITTFCVFQLLKAVAGADYIVGEHFVTGALWTNEPGPSGKNLSLLQQYELWTKSVKISVGDTLIFNYDDKHTVVLVSTQEMLNSCNYTTYEDVTSPTPPTAYTVKNVQPLYFLCSVGKHCQDGQKVAITDISGGSTPPVVPSPSPSASNQGRWLQSVRGFRWCLTLGASLLVLHLIVR
ncbi:hypothetical protein R1sor_001264 [Riccia sorocarpa]|uniref:Phytocyanin domain-containing protein n=1 Tax=Riccia sorocarpa TaxID=122646 RepID=A0ABD3GYK8_9MARC